MTKLQGESQKIRSLRIFRIVGLFDSASRQAKKNRQAVGQWRFYIRLKFQSEIKEKIWTACLA